MRQFIGILLFCIGISGCTDELSSSSGTTNYVRISMALQGINDFSDYIGYLTIYAFRENSKGEYVFYRKLAELNRNDINKLESAVPPGENYTESKLFHSELPLGNYRLYVIGNAQVERREASPAGDAVPANFYFTYPEDGLYWAYFLGKKDIQAGSNSQIVRIELHRIVSRILLKLYSIPYQIDTIRMTLKDIAYRIHLDGTYSGTTQSEQHVFRMKNEDVYLQDTIFFDMFTFPSARDSSELELIFQAKNGQKRYKSVPVKLDPDHYLYLTGRINSACGALLSFEFSCVYFFAWDWRNIVLPEFPLKPL